MARIIGLLLFVWCTSLPLPRLTPDEKIALKRASTAADKSIHFKSIETVQADIQSGLWVLFFGANWCSNTHAFTPKYLRVQELANDEKWAEMGLNMAKIECTTDKEVGCFQKFGVNAYPTVLSFKDGKPIEEYIGDDEEESFVEYIRTLMDTYGTPEVKASVQVEESSIKLKGNSVVSKEEPVESAGLSDESGQDTDTLSYILAGGICFVLLSVIYSISKSTKVSPYRKMKE